VFFAEMKRYLVRAARLFQPRSENEDDRRREFIFNVLVVSVGLLIAVATIESAVAVVFYPDPIGRAHTAISFGILFSILGFLVGLYLWARQGFIYSASYLFIGFVGFFALYLGVQWGIDVVASLLLYALTIVMAGVLISARFAFATTAAVAFAMVIVGELQSKGVIEANTYWKTEQWVHSDTFVTSIIFAVIATVSWLANREIEKSLARARASEKALKRERDTLEIRVAERTQELRKIELEKMSQLYRFVEFGKLTSGLVHDLINPLNTLSLNIESIAETHEARKSGEFSALSGDLDRARSATSHMRSVLDSMRNHLVHDRTDEQFSVSTKIAEVAHVFQQYARSRNVTLRIELQEDIRLYGDAGLFTQVITNLISNAIEAYPLDAGTAGASNNQQDRVVVVTLTAVNNTMEMAVVDHGIGMAKDIHTKIFEPFFTTKPDTHGIGLGLSLVKRTVEKEFNGTLTVTSSPGKGSTFTVRIPIRV
jgi:signal transduction histidine kinase